MRRFASPNRGFRSLEPLVRDQQGWQNVGELRMTAFAVNSKSENERELKVRGDT